MNEHQQKFFAYLFQIQISCVEICMIEHKNHDPEIERMLYDVTYHVITSIMEMIDGYSTFSPDKYDIINTVTGERLKENPFIELHDQTDGLLKYES